MLKTIGEVVVSHRDRLGRIGSELLEKCIKIGGGKLTILNDELDKSLEQELAEELLSVTHYYSSRMYSRRRHSKKRVVKIFYLDFSYLPLYMV